MRFRNMALAGLAACTLAVPTLAAEPLKSAVTTGTVTAPTGVVYMNGPCYYDFLALLHTCRAGLEIGYTLNRELVGEEYIEFSYIEEFLAFVRDPAEGYIEWFGWMSGTTTETLYDSSYTTYYTDRKYMNEGWHGSSLEDLVTVKIEFFNLESPVSYTLFATELPVPEPSTWAMLILGFGLVGVASRRQRVRVAG